MYFLYRSFYFLLQNLFPSIFFYVLEFQNWVSGILICLFIDLLFEIIFFLFQACETPSVPTSHDQVLLLAILAIK
jgi:hypothetical protein